MLAVDMAAEPGPSSTGPEGRATGFFCSTSGTYFTDKESLAEHYRSDFHRYNLKRKVAGLPPVTKEWFEARKAQLASASAAPTQRIWYDPLTRRKFMSEAKYREHVTSKKYADLVKKSGEPAPAPVVMLKRLDEAAAAPAAAAAGGGAAAAGTSTAATGGGGGAAAKPAAGFVVKAPHRPASAAEPRAAAEAESDEEEEETATEEEEEEEEGSGWETASDEEEGDATGEALAAATAGLTLGAGARKRLAARRAAAAPAAAAAGSDAEEGEEEEEEEDGDWEEWDVRRCLFDNRVAPTLQDNLEYMWKRYGFYLPDSEYLVDPEGLIKYLGSKLQYGKVPLYTRGDDPNARQFRSLHAVQRHMVDANRCKLQYDDNEEEYADFYDYSTLNNGAADGAENEAAAEGADGQLVAAGGGGIERFATSGLELMVGGNEAGGGSGGKVLGSRWLARYYRQRPRPAAAAAAAAAASGGARGLIAGSAAAGVVAQYRALGVETRDAARAAERRAQRATTRAEKQRLNLFMKANVLHNLPKNVPY